MRNLLFIVAGYGFIYFCCVQAELYVIFFDVEVPYKNPEYLQDFDGYITNDGNEAIAFNVTVIKQFPAGIMGHLSLIGASMGEYVVTTGIDYYQDFCESFDEPIVMGRLLAMFGFKKESCPPEPGVYGAEDFLLDTKTLPDEFPRNKYLVIYEIFKKTGEKILMAYVYLQVQ